MRKFVAGTLGILLAILTISDIGQAQGITTVQGTIQAVDCRTSSLVLKAPDGTHVFPTAPNTPVFVNSTPIGLCTLQQYIGSSATVSIAPRGDQWVAERVDVYAAAPAPTNTAPSVSSAPPWLGIVLGTIIVGGLVYLLVRGRDGSVQRYPYSGPYDQSQYGPYQNGGDYGPYPYGPYQHDPYQRGPYQYDPYQRGPYEYGPRPYGPYQNGPHYGPYPYGAYPNGPYYYGPYPYGIPRNCPQGTWCYRRDAGDSSR